MATFTLRSINFTYADRERPALKQISFTVDRGAFLLLCGRSGCGKTTLLRLLKPQLTPGGALSGDILFDDVPISSYAQDDICRRIGFVMQSPDAQIATDKVWHELAFGAESLGWDNGVIQRRVAETASFFGIQTWFHKNVNELSGGQKQLLNLASVMVMQPDVLILDEPTSQLDPISAADFLATLAKLNRELGTTVILSEHRLEEAFAYASDVLVMEDGQLFYRGTPAAVGAFLCENKHSMFLAMPVSMRIWDRIDEDIPCPITVRDGKSMLDQYSLKHEFSSLPPEHGRVISDETALQMEEVWFRYQKELPDTIKGLSFTVYKGSCFALLGGNGSGKTTALKLAAEIIKPYRGKITKNGTAVMLPQDPQTMFVKNTVSDELYDMLRDRKCAKQEKEKKIGDIASLCRIEQLLYSHPYDLSGGEQQRAALAKLLLLDPDILLLDEPTKGLDAEFKQIFAAILKELTQSGRTVLLVSHDIEFCASYADICAMFFDGAVSAQASPREFFSGNSYYTTAANRMSRHLIPDAITINDVITACGKKTIPETAANTSTEDLHTDDLKKDNKLCTKCMQIPALQSKQKRKYGYLSYIPLLTMPLTLWFGTQVLNNRKYYFISILLLFELLCAFYLQFELKKTSARYLVTAASLCAIAIAGRAAFFMLPQCKPVLAITIISGIALGGETGFLVGSVTMLISNMLFSQGPWTPWQMMAMGIIGYLAGVIFRKKLLPCKKNWICIFGMLTAIFIYGTIMNTASALIWTDSITMPILLSYYITGFPMDCIHAAATVLFLYFGAEPLLEKLYRVIKKYKL